MCFQQRLYSFDAEPLGPQRAGICARLGRGFPLSYKRKAEGKKSACFEGFPARLDVALSAFVRMVYSRITEGTGEALRISNETVRK